MIELENIIEAYQDINNAAEEGGFDLNDILMRYEMLDVDFEDFQLFTLNRMRSLSAGRTESWAKGYVQGAMEFFLYGILTGREDALDSEIKRDDRS